MERRLTTEDAEDPGENFRKRSPSRKRSASETDFLCVLCALWWKGRIQFERAPKTFLARLPAAPTGSLRMAFSSSAIIR